jgi:hypothetical protein
LESFGGTACAGIESGNCLFGWNRRAWRAAAGAHKFHRIVLKMRQVKTFLATFEFDHQTMKTLAVISLLALLTISGAAYTDQLLTSEQRTARVN